MDIHSPWWLAGKAAWSCLGLEKRDAAGMGRRNISEGEWVRGRRWWKRMFLSGSPGGGWELLEVGVWGWADCMGEDKGRYSRISVDRVLVEG